MDGEACLWTDGTDLMEGGPWTVKGVCGRTAQIEWRVDHGRCSVFVDGRHRLKEGRTV